MKTKIWKKWTTEEIATLVDKYPHVATQEVALELGRSKYSVYVKAERLLLKKSSSYLDEIGKRLAISGNQTRTRQGTRPWNKGLHFTSWGRSAETRFKQGNRPHSWRPIGTERFSKDGYLERKMTDTGKTMRDYVPVHHLVWREAGREIPNGSVLVFRDGDKLNFALDNLELISRKELMRRNSVHNYGPEIAQLIQLRGAISRQINQRKGKAP